MPRPTKASSEPGPRQRILTMGVARDVSMLRAETGLSTRAVAQRLSWSSHNEVARYEHGSPGSGSDPGTRAITVRRYLELLRFYFSQLPAGRREAHPGGALLLSKEAAELLREGTPDLPLFHYLEFARSKALAGILPDTDPGVRLWRYLHQLGSGGRGT